MNLEQLMTMWESDCKIDDNHLGEASTDTPNLHSKYINHLVSYKLKLAKLKGEYNLLRKNKFRYYRGELSRQELEDYGWQQWQGVKPLKNEMDEFLQGDTDLVQMEQKVEYLNTIVYFLESVLSQIRSRDFQIKNGIQWKQFLVGM
jgi:hypothetical protein